MTKKAKAKRVLHLFILDRTGSMGDPADPGSKLTKAEVATTGIAGYVEAQKGDGVLFTAYEFDTYGTDKIADRASWFNWTCVPRNGTPLLDAVGTVLQTEAPAIDALPKAEKPDRVFVVIATDGQENASREWSKQAVGKLIADRTKAGWDVVFIGANFDAFSEAGGIGVRRGSTMSTNTANKGAYAASFAATSSAVTRAAAGGQSVSYTPAERTWAEQGDEAETKTEK
jgi:hypothetical protein